MEIVKCGKTLVYDVKKKDWQGHQMQWWALPLIISLVRSSALSGGAIGERNAKSGSSL
ncbi:Hypothetical protein FKW44_016562 [Caligus rogercresseyi]|uniref:Uncharacterized protein n=1 Tax=Caligus rogercresseyi TaxID=217165 RepID=A0A7T8H298_CALRO|nr:Hypothetical protein FKW44_016562 [Caligus rogercresseyi]